ncbi:MAG: hypothetical protein P8Y63_00175 [Deltaproteobacteria bacterium]|jgi:hypothetical protein
MKRFESLAAVNAAGLPPDISRVVARVLADLVRACEMDKGYYAPAEDGFVVLLEEADGRDQWLDIFGWALPEADFEEVSRQDGCFLATVLNEEFGISLVIPDRPWLPADVREILESELQPAR